MKIGKYYLCKNRENGFLHIYLSRNGTPWHDSRVSIVGGKKYNRYFECVYGLTTEHYRMCNSVAAVAKIAGVDHPNFGELRGWNATLGQIASEIQRLQDENERLNNATRSDSFCGADGYHKENSDA